MALIIMDNVILILESCSGIVYSNSNLDIKLYNLKKLKKYQNHMKRKDAIRLFFRSILTSKFGAVETDNGTLYFDGEEIQIGTEVKVEDTSNEDNIDYIPVPDGE